MRTLVLAFVMSVAACLPHTTVARQPDDNSNLVKSAKEIEARSLSGLGIGVRAISLLLDASPSSFRPKWSLERNGTWPLIVDLEAKGYVKLSISSGLPNGGNKDEQFVTYVATEKGKAVISVFVAK